MKWKHARQRGFLGFRLPLISQAAYSCGKMSRGPESQLGKKGTGARDPDQALELGVNRDSYILDGNSIVCFLEHLILPWESRVRTGHLSSTHFTDWKAEGRVNLQVKDTQDLNSGSLAPEPVPVSVTTLGHFRSAEI